MRILIVSDGPLDYPLGNRRILMTTAKFFIPSDRKGGYYSF